MFSLPAVEQSTPRSVRTRENKHKHDARPSSVGSNVAWNNVLLFSSSTAAGAKRQDTLLQVSAEGKEEREVSTHSLRLGIIHAATVNAAENIHMNTDPFTLWKALVICRRVIEFFFLRACDCRVLTNKKVQGVTLRLLISTRRRVATAIYTRDNPSISSPSVQITGRGLQTSFAETQPSQPCFFLNQ